MGLPDSHGKQIDRLNKSVECIHPEPIESITSMITLSNLWDMAGIILLGYFTARVGSFLFTELRNTIFSKVTQRSIRLLSHDCFLHLLKLDHHFHISNKSSIIGKNLDRGSRGIQFILSSIVFNLIPTGLEISLVCGILVRFNFKTDFLFVYFLI